MDFGTRETCLGALWRFAELANVIHPKKIRAYFEHLFAAFCSIAARPEDIVHDKLADYYELIFRILGPSIGDKEIKVSAGGIHTRMPSEERCSSRGNRFIVL